MTSLDRALAGKGEVVAPQSVRHDRPPPDPALTPAATATQPSLSSLSSGSHRPIVVEVAKMAAMPLGSARPAGSTPSTRLASLRRRTRSRSGTDAGDALATLHREQYGSLVRLANLLLGDQGRSEEVVQDAFVKLQLRWGGLRQLDRAPAYLRSVVLNGARSSLRHGKVVGRHAERRTVLPDVPTPEAGALAGAEHQRMVTALRLLPPRQREALALRYYLDLGERDMAAAMGVSPGSVKTHLRRGLAALAELLGDEAGGGSGSGEPAGRDPGGGDPAAGDSHASGDEPTGDGGTGGGDEAGSSDDSGKAER